MLVPSSPEFLLTLIEGPKGSAEVARPEAAPGLREFFTSGDVSAAWLAELRAAHGADPWRHGFLLVERESSLAVGTAGFKGPPDAEGTVEIAYGVVPSREGRGYATEAVDALVAYARQARARRIRAHTLPERNASTRVLEKCGFAQVGSVVDPDDGTVWRWEIP
jgi:RimJ/RimL family protein N-acetyltransferase